MFFFLGGLPKEPGQICDSGVAPRRKCEVVNAEEEITNHQSAITSVDVYVCLHQRECGIVGIYVLWPKALQNQ